MSGTGEADLTALDRDSLVHLAEAFGNPLVLLVSLMPCLSKQHCAAARDAQAVLVQWQNERLESDAVVAGLAVSCPQLLSLNLQNCDNITDAAVAALAASCPQLSLLDLRGCYNITDAAVAALAASCDVMQEQSDEESEEGEEEDSEEESED